MNKHTISYIVIGAISLVYLFILSSTLLSFTNFNNAVIFNLVSTIALFFLLVIIYQLYIEQVQLTTYELLYVLGIYLIIFIFFTFSKQQVIKEPEFKFEILPTYFKMPTYLNYIYMMWNVLIFLPLGFFYRKYKLKLSFLAILAFSVALAYVSYLTGFNNFALSDILIHIIGFYIGWIYAKATSQHSSQWDNISYDVRLNITLMASAMIIISLIYPFVA